MRPCEIIRLKLKRTQKEMGAILGRSKGFYHHLEKGTRKVQIDEATKLKALIDEPEFGVFFSTLEILENKDMPDQILENKDIPDQILENKAAPEQK